jgi:hypothetical protein
MPPRKPLRFLANVRDGRVVIDEAISDNDALALEGATLTLEVVGVVSDRCRAVWHPGILNGPGNTMPTVRTRCTSATGHKGPHSFEPQVDPNDRP